MLFKYQNGMDRLKEQEQYKYALIESLPEHMISYVYTCEAQFLSTKFFSNLSRN